MTETNTKRNWLNDVGGVSNWMGNYCRDYLRKNPDLKEDNDIVVVMKNLTSQQKVCIEGILEEKVEKNRLAAYVYIEEAYATGALKAFKAKDYACSLIHHYIGAKDLKKILLK